MRRRVSLLCALALLAPAAAWGLTSDPVGVAAQKISAGETVYVDPSAEARLTPGQAATVRRAIQRDAGGQMYVAVLPASAAAGGGAGAAVDRFRAGVGFPGVYVLVAGQDLRAAGTYVDGGPLATAAVRAHRADGLPAILEDLAKRVGNARQGVTDHSFGAAGWIAPLVVLLGGAALAVVLLRRHRRAPSEPDRGWDDWDDDRAEF